MPLNVSAGASPVSMPARMVLLTGLTLLAPGCAGEPNVTRSTSPATSTPPLVIRTATPYVRPGLVPARVTRVVDGDTIHVEVGGKDYRLRYIGIDTPETVDPRRPVGCFGAEASERNRQLVEGRTVGLEKDVSETDSFGRLLRYVWVEDQMVNEALVEEGYALAAPYPPDVRYSGVFVCVHD